VTWTVESATDERAWFKEAVDHVLSTTTRPLPPTRFSVGASTISWLENEPGVASIFAEGGNLEDRLLARDVARVRLAYHGYRQAQYTFDQDGLIKEAGWDDIMVKAKRLIQAGNVNLLRNSANVIVGQVQGDHGEYQTEIARDDPDSRVITQWTCECPWDQFAFQRTRQWKKYEGRPCAHVLATYWKSLGTPVDEEVSPHNRPGDQMGLPGLEPGELQQTGPGHFVAPPSRGRPLQPLGQPPMPSAPPANVGPQLSIPGLAPPPGPQPLPMPGAQPTPPPSPDRIPPFPMDQIQEQLDAIQPAPPPTVSVPGAKPPTPANPVQYPGGTFSSWKFAAELQPGIAAVMTKPEMGTAVGKSTEHGAGAWREIPAGAVVEVVHQDPTTGFVEIRWPLHTAGPMEPFHVECAVDPSFLNARPDLPNPFEKTWRKV
jgi:hypothetical protein